VIRAPEIELSRWETRTASRASRIEAHSIPLEHTMYDMYPDWGPARHRDHTSDEAALQSVQAGLDRRDNGGERPDDN
jgi:hypothetical protein